jgi:hypothetical protein
MRATASHVAVIAAGFQRATSRSNKSGDDASPAAQIFVATLNASASHVTSRGDVTLFAL